MKESNSLEEINYHFIIKILIYIINNELKENLPNITKNDIKENAKIYYMNKKSGTVYDWSYNQKLPDFVCFYNDNSELVRLSLNKDKSIYIRLYSNKNKIPIIEEKIENAFDSKDIYDLAVILNKVMDDNHIFDKALNDYNTNIKLTDNDINNFQKRVIEIIAKRRKNPNSLILNVGLTILIILDVITILFFFIAFSINIKAVISSFILILFITLFIIGFWKIKKEPLNVYKFSAYLNKGFISNIFNEEIKIINVVQVVEDQAVAASSDEYIEKCIDFFQNLDEKQMNNLINLSINYYNKFNDNKDFEISKNTKILKYIHPKIMRVGDGSHLDNEIKFIVECSCDWNKHDGLKIVVEDNKIIYVGEIYDNKSKNINGYRNRRKDL